MNEELELALSYWRSMSPQPKAIVYANSIEARLKGIETNEMVIDHELTNAIERGASIARGRSMKPATVKAEHKAEARPIEPTNATDEAGKPKTKRTLKAKAAEQG